MYVTDDTSQTRYRTVLLVGHQPVLNGIAESK